MKVLKFGGTSVGSPERMKKLLDIINPAERQIVVLSAVSGTTNSLVEIGQAYLAGDKHKAADLIAALKVKYEYFIKELYAKPEYLDQGKEVIDYHFDLLSNLSNDLFTNIEDKIILAQGELLSTTLYHVYLKEIGVPSVLLPALDFMKIDEDNEPIVIISLSISPRCWISILIIICLSPRDTFAAIHLARSITCAEEAAITPPH